MNKPVNSAQPGAERGDTPLVDAELVNGTSYTVAKLARRLERDRGMLMDVLREVNASYQDGYLKGHATIIRQIRTLLSKMKETT